MCSGSWARPDQESRGGRGACSGRCVDARVRIWTWRRGGILDCTVQ